MAMSLSVYRFPLQEVLHLEAVPGLSVHVPEHHRAHHPADVVLPPESMFIGQERSPHQPELTVLPAVCHDGIPVLHVVQQAFQPFRHQSGASLVIVFLQADAYGPPSFGRFVCRSPFLVSFHIQCLLKVTRQIYVPLSASDVFKRNLTDGLAAPYVFSPAFLSFPAVPFPPGWCISP